MNRKYLNSALIVLLVIIWGSVFYKYFGVNKSLEKKQYATNIEPNYNKEYGTAKDTFQLKLIDRDPFGISRVKRIRISKPSVKKPMKKVKPILNKSMVWPAISYHGFVKSEQSATRLILLKIDNSVYRKREKEIVHDVTLVKAYNDSLIVSLNNNIKTIKRQ